MKIPNTELEHDEIEGKVLDYYLGGNAETKEEWAQRVWDFCKRKSRGENLPEVYQANENQTWQDRAKELWINKIGSRTKSIMRELDISLRDLPNIENNPKYQTRKKRDSLNR